MPPIATILLLVLFVLAVGAVWWRRAVAREVADLRRRQHELAGQERHVAANQDLADDLTGPRKTKRAVAQQAQEAHRLAGSVDHELRLAEHALMLGRLGKARELSRRAARDEALLEDALEGATQALRALGDDRRGVARTLAEAASLLTYLRGRVARLPGKLGAGLPEALDAVARDLDEARAMSAAGEPARALARARNVRLALVATRRALMRRTAARTWLEAAPAEVARLEAEAERLQRAGFVHLPALQGEGLRQRAAAITLALDAGELRALEREAALRAELQRLAEQLGRFEALHRRNEEAITRMSHELAELGPRLAAVLPGQRADHFARPDRRPILQARDRLDARLRALEMTLRTAAADNHKDAQRFTEASLRLATLERELAATGRELARVEARAHYLETEERHLQERLGRLADDVAALDAAAQRLGMRPDPGVAALLDAARETLEREPVSLEVAGRALDGLLGAAEAYGQRIRRLSERLEPRPGNITLYKPRQEARLPGRDPEH